MTPTIINHLIRKFLIFLPMVATLAGCANVEKTLECLINSDQKSGYYPPPVINDTINKDYENKMIAVAIGCITRDVFKRNSQNSSEIHISKITLDKLSVNLSTMPAESQINALHLFKYYHNRLGEIIIADSRLIGIKSEVNEFIIELKADVDFDSAPEGSIAINPRERLISLACTNELSREFMDNLGILTFVIFDRYGSEIYKIPVSKHTCL
jgi:hypothetical protein